VAHPDQAAAARLDRDFDPLGAGVEGVLDQFLSRRGRPLDHLARGDAIDEQRIETTNRHGSGILSRLIARDQAPRKRLPRVSSESPGLPPAGSRRRLGRLALMPDPRAKEVRRWRLPGFGLSPTFDVNPRL